MRVIHQSQLTEEFDGTLPYDNSEWIDIRMVGRESHIISRRMHLLTDTVIIHCSLR